MIFDDLEQIFGDYIVPQYLYGAAMIFGSITLLLVLMIYVYLFVKKRRFIVRGRISELMEDWISEALTEENPEAIIISPELDAYLQHPAHRQFIISTLVNIRKNVAGIAVTNIVNLYLKLGLKKDSVNKMGSVVWHKKAKGIFELYMMTQADQLPAIFKYANSNNEFVRMEAQIAIIGFSGFNGLVFLDELQYSLTEWQQLKLLEQLDALNTVQMAHLPQWLASVNDYVVIFALRLADIYQQLQVHDEVVKCLKSNNDKIRCQAIQTLGRVANDHTNEILRVQYTAEIPGNRQEILKVLAVTGTDEDVPFLLDVFDHTEGKLQLEAGRAITRISSNGVALLDERAGENAVMQSINRQIKYELAR